MIHISICKAAEQLCHLNSNLKLGSQVHISQTSENSKINKKARNNISRTGMKKLTFFEYLSRRTLSLCFVSNSKNVLGQFGRYLMNCTGEQCMGDK